MKIEKNIPIPEKNTGPKELYPPLLKQMQIGDSILLTTSQYAGLNLAARKMGIKITSRAVDNKRRVWRIG